MSLIYSPSSPFGLVLIGAILCLMRFQNLLVTSAKSGRDVEQMDYKENLDSLMANMR